MQQHGSGRMDITPLVPLCLAAFAGFLNLFGMNPFFVEIADETGSTVSMVGYSSTAALLMTAIAGLVVGPVSQRVGVRRILVVGLILAAGGAVATALAVNFGSLVLARLLAGVGGSITGGVTVSAAALIYSGRQRQRALAFVTAAAATAVVIGVFLMTTLAGPFGWRGAFLILGAALLGISLLSRIMLQPHRESDDPAPLGFRALVDAYRPILGEPSLRRLFTGATLHPAVLNGSTAYVGAFLVSQQGMSTQVVGLVFSLIGITYFVGNLIAGSLRGPRYLIFSIGVLLMGGFWALGYLLPLSPVIIAAMFGMATFFAGVAWVTVLNMIADRTPANVGTSMVLSSSMLSLGGAVGIAAGAGLLDITGYSGLALGMGTLALLGAFAGWVGPEPETETESTGTPDASRLEEEPLRSRKVSS